MSFFGIILTSAVTLLQAYVFLRLWSIPFIKRHIQIRTYLMIAVLLWILFYLGRVFGGHERLVEIVLEFIGMHLMGILFLVSIGFLLADFITLFGLFFRKSLPVIRTAGLVFGLLMSISAHIQGIRPPVPVKYEIYTNNMPENLPDSFSIAVMADIHGGEMLIGPEWIQKRIDETMKLKPDLVVLAGDIFERASDPDLMVPVMTTLKAPLGVWAVRGNHDSRRENRRDVMGEILQQSGIRLLENEWVEIADGLVISGIDDLTLAKRREESGKDYIKNALGNIPPGFTVLISHTPWETRLIAQQGADLMISGHTHNGQIWPFNLLARTRYPYMSGEYDIMGMKLVVNRGTGTWGPRMRLWKPGEISLITVRGK